MTNIDYEIIDDDDVVYFRNAKEVYERFELMNYGLESSPIVFGKRFVKNSDGKIYSYNTYVYKDVYEFEKKKYLMNSALTNLGSFFDEYTFLQAYHKSYGRKLTNKELSSLRNSKEYDSDDNSKIWTVLGYYKDKNVTLGLKR